MAEIRSLAVTLKAMNKPLSMIPIDNLFPIRLENDLRNREVQTLGDIVAKGYRTLFRRHHIGKVGLDKITEMLGYFGEKLPD